MQKLIIAFLLIKFIIADYFDKFSNFISEEMQLVNAQLYNFTQFNYQLINKTQDLELSSGLIMKYFYKKHNLMPQIILQLNEQVDQMEILLNPCKNLNKAMCVPGLNKTQYIDQFLISQTNDLLIAWKSNKYVIQCSDSFYKYFNCGTYLEIHRLNKIYFRRNHYYKKFNLYIIKFQIINIFRPYNPDVLSEQKVSSFYSPKFSFEYVSLKHLCAGKYEIWLVQRTRLGKFLEYVKPFFLEYPSCKCDNLVVDNQNCQD